ncbi:MAG: extracellular solute-binding protein [Anaerolineae bacterium]|nr:extracellular solute-binding protein [Anaerolineae bacterium]
MVITFACFDSDKAYYEDAIEAFEQANPDIHIQLVSLDDVFGPPPADGRYAADISRRVAAAADTLALSPDPDMVRQNLVRDLTPLIDVDAAFDVQDFYPTTLDAVQWNGGTWALPVSVRSFHMIYYDQEAFDAAGVAYPEPGWTWDDFLSKAQALTERQGDRVQRWGFVERVWVPSPFVQGRVGPLVDSSGESPATLLNRAALADALRWYTDLALVHQAMPVPERVEALSTSSEFGRLVEERRAAMWSGPSILWEQWSAGRELGIVPFPVDSSTAATTPVSLNTVVMSAGTTHPEASWRWLVFLSRQMTAGSHVPARRSVAESSSYWKSLDAGLAPAYQYALEHGLSNTKSWMGAGDALYDALESILRADMDVEQALVEMERSIQAGGETEPAARGEPPAVATPRSEQAIDSVEHTIVFVPHDSEPRQAYDALAAEFQRDHPEIVIEVHTLSELVGGGTRTSSHELLPILAQDADCWEMPWQTWSDQDLVHFLPLDPLVEADLAFAVDDFYTPALDAVRLEGQLLALPLAVHPRMIFYHKSLFDAAGLNYPSPDWTLDDFVTVALALTQDEGGRKRYGYLSDPQGADAAFFIEQYGTQLFDLSGPSVTYHFDAPATVRAVQWYAGLSAEHGVMPEPEFESIDVETAVAQSRSWQSKIDNKQTAMWSGPPAYLPQPSTPEQAAEIGMAPMPWGAGEVVDLQLNALYISAQTEHPQACWEWVMFLTMQPGLFSSREDGLPTRYSLFASTAYRGRVGNVVADAYEQVLEKGDRPGLSLYTMNRPDVGYPLSWFFAAVQAVIDGQDAEQVLGEAQRRADAFVACLQTTQGLEGEELARACAVQVDPGFTFYEH